MLFHDLQPLELRVSPPQLCRDRPGGLSASFLALTLNLGVLCLPQALLPNSVPGSSQPSPGGVGGGVVLLACSSALQEAKCQPATGQL